jgi:hypothetical protein
MHQNLWLVIVVVVGWTGFLLGYAVSSQTGTKGGGEGAPAAAAPAAPAAGGYGR